MGYIGTMKIALIENIRYLCENIQETQNQGRRAEEIIDSISFIERILKEDHSEFYPLMDISTRKFYRGKVEELAAIYGVSEIHIEKEAVERPK